MQINWCTVRVNSPSEVHKYYFVDISKYHILLNVNTNHPRQTIIINSRICCNPLRCACSPLPTQNRIIGFNYGSVFCKWQRPFLLCDGPGSHAMPDETRVVCQNKSPCLFHFKKILKGKQHRHNYKVVHSPQVHCILLKRKFLLILISIRYIQLLSKFMWNWKFASLYEVLHSSRRTFHRLMAHIS